MARESQVFELGHAGYPARLRDLGKPPPRLTVAGELAATGLRVAVVGTRKPSAEALSFTRELARAIAERGGVVVSGGAVGIDAAAHEGAILAGGATWVVAATGPDEVFPRENAGLFDRVADGAGAMIWPFDPGRKAHPATFIARNGVLVALADVLVVVQASAPSGTLNAGGWARKLGRPVWAVCAPPWMPGFVGCASLIDRGARPLVSLSRWLTAVGFGPSSGGAARRVAGGAPALPGVLRAALDPGSRDLLSFLSATRPQHIDEIAAKSGLSAQVGATALLTLALEDVLVEGPEGQFRLATSR